MTLTVHDVGALLFSYDIGFQDETHFFREIGVCDVRRENHPHCVVKILPCSIWATKLMPLQRSELEKATQDVNLSRGGGGGGSQGNFMRRCSAQCLMPLLYHFHIRSVGKYYSFHIPA